MIRNLLFCAMMLLGTVVAAEGDSGPRVRSYEIDVTFRPDAGRLEAQALVRLADRTDGLPRLVFYLHDELQVRAIRAGEVALPFHAKQVPCDHSYTLKASRVTIDLAEQAPFREFTIYYAGSMHASSARSPSDYMRIDSEGVFLRAYGYSLWFPIFLEPGQDGEPADFRKVVLRTPEAFIPVFVGERIAEEVSGGTRISEWRASGLPLYAPQITAQRYVMHSEGSYFIYSWRDDESQKVVPEMAAFARKLIGQFRRLYRADAATMQVHIVQMPKYGHISSHNMVGLATESWQAFGEDEHALRTLAHEFVHPFVRVPIPADDPLRAFMIEGFPSYFHMPVLARILGEERYEAFMDRVAENYLRKKSTGRDRRGNPLPPEKPLLAIAEDEIGAYKDTFILSDRGLLFWDYLRRAMGREAFHRLTRDLFNRESINSASFRQGIQAYLPISSEDLHLWLETNEYPARFHR